MVLHKCVCTVTAQPYSTQYSSDYGIVNPRRAWIRVVGFVCVVCLSVCLSVRSHLTSETSLRPEIDITYSTGNEGHKICGFFRKRFIAEIQHSLRRMAIYTGGHFHAHALYL